MNFYSRPHGRGDPDSLIIPVDFVNFYSRPHGRGDPRCAMTWLPRLVFLLAPPREGRLGSRPPRAGCISYFYSRPHGRGDLYPEGSLCIR